MYLANALVPDDPRIEITGQRRDAAQHELTIEYSFWPPASARRALTLWQGAAGLLVVALVGIFLKTKRSPREIAG